MKARYLIILLLPALLVACRTGGVRPIHGGVADAGGADPSLTVLQYTLDNGLRLLIVPRPGVPIASFVVQYRIGSVNEAPGNTGIAHFLEHLLFKGTTSVGTVDYPREADLMARMDRLFDSTLALRPETPGDSGTVSELMRRIRTLEEEASQVVVSNEFDHILSENGARNLNATTTSESTTYFVEIPSNRAELWFVLEADRLKNPVFREFYTERDVVAEERRLRLENNPGGLLYEAHMAAAFREHPYGTPVVGQMEDLQRFTRKDVEGYFRQYYRPNNAVVAVAGDVDPDQILRWAEAYLGSIPRGEDPPPVERPEPIQEGERRTEVVYNAEPAVRMGWKVPSALHEDAPSLYMLMSVLTGGRSSRLYRRLVLQDRIASAVTSSIGPGQLYPGLFTIQASPLHPHGTLELEAAVYEELERLRKAPPDERELQRVRNQIEASEFRRLRSSFGLALQVAGSASLYGDWRRTFEFSRAMQAVTPSDIQRVVETYFKAETRTVATLVKPPSHQGQAP
jgi:predicted Zn-dependent peptidase